MSFHHILHPSRTALREDLSDDKFLKIMSDFCPRAVSGKREGELCSRSDGRHVIRDEDSKSKLCNGSSYRPGKNSSHTIMASTINTIGQPVAIIKYGRTMLLEVLNRSRTEDIRHQCCAAKSRTFE